MASAQSLPLNAISERDQVSLGLAAVAVVLVLMAGQIRLSPDTEILASTISLTTDVVQPEQIKQPTVEQQKNEQKSQATPTSKADVTEKVTKVDDSESTATQSAPSRPSQAAAAPALASPEVNRVDADRDFENKIRFLIEGSKRYPTGREASLQKPQGVVVACVTLLRDGNLQEMKIQKSSTYPILDNAAKRLLANLQYPQMPQDIFSGHASHSFCVNLDYKVPT